MVFGWRCHPLLLWTRYRWIPDRGYGGHTTQFWMDTTWTYGGFYVHYNVLSPVISPFLWVYCCTRAARATSIYDVAL